MAARKKEPKPKKVRFILGREMSKDAMVKAIGKICTEAGIEFIPDRPKKRKK